MGHFTFSIFFFTLAMYLTSGVYFAPTALLSDQPYFQVKLYMWLVATTLDGTGVTSAGR